MSKIAPTPEQRDNFFRSHVKTLEGKSEFERLKPFLTSLFGPDTGKVIHEARRLLGTRGREISYPPSLWKFITLKLQKQKFRLVLQQNS